MVVAAESRCVKKIGVRLKVILRTNWAGCAAGGLAMESSEEGRTHAGVQ